MHIKDSRLIQNFQAVSIGVGTDSHGNASSTLDVFPAGYSYNLFLGSDYCNASSSCATAQANGGLYNTTNSTSVYVGIQDGPGVVSTMSSDDARNEAGSASVVLDRVRLINTTGSPITIANSSIDIVHEELITFPDGTSYSPSIGFLAIASLNSTRGFTHAQGQIAPNYLYNKGITPSASMGLHYGSARVGPTGSLVWGGYDRSRVIGDVGVFNVSPATYPTQQLIQVNLVDIVIGVESGTSPFASQMTGSQVTTAGSPPPPPMTTGLLKADNAYGPWQPAIINPTLTFLYLSPDTCTNIAKFLPVTLLQQKGIYLWNTTDPYYQRIVNSSAYLGFVFQPSATSSPTVTIKIPFKLLDLTLESPILTSPQQYFPCSPYNVTEQEKGVFLGRSFLQAAFLGANLNQTAFFLAQGPGPDADAPDIQPIPLASTMIESLPSENFVKSWANHWTVLNETNSTSDSGNNGGFQKTSSSDDGGSRPPLSPGAKAGIAISAATIAFALILGTTYLVFRRRRRQRQHKTDITNLIDRNLISQPIMTAARSTGGPQEMAINSRPSEIGTGSHLAHEAPVHEIFETGDWNELVPELPAEDK